MPEMVTIKYDDLSAAFDFVTFAAPFEHRAFVSLDTGAIHWISETTLIDEKDLPDDLETSDRYIAVPHKNDPTWRTISRVGLRKSSCRIGTRTLRFVVATVERTRVSKIFFAAERCP
jgi:hypothetical protein